jgi:hypothetical protein
MKHAEGVVNFLFAEHPVFTGLHANDIKGNCPKVASRLPLAVV